MHVLTALGYVAVVKRASGWWEVQRDIYRAASTSLPRALSFVGIQAPEARTIAGNVSRRSHLPFHPSSSSDNS